MTAPAFTLTNESVTVIHEGKPHTIQKGMTQFHVLRTAIITAIQTDDWSSVISSLTVFGSLAQYLGDRWSADGRTLKLDGHEVPASISNRIQQMATNGESPMPVFRFYERLAKNPSRRSVQQLFDFLKHSNIPLEEDGRFLAYKAVKSDFKDVHSGTVDNHPGQINKLDRNLVSDDPNEACHYGFHVGALGYASTFHTAGEMIVCRVDPEHVVCVPYDYSHQKMRVCEYEVVGMYSGTPMSSTVHKEELVADEEGEWKDDDEDEDSDAGEGDDEDEDGDDDDESEAEDEEQGALQAAPTDLAKLHADYDAEPASKEPDLRNNQAQNTDVVVKQLKKVDRKAAKNKAGTFRRMDAKKLMSQSIGDLRSYAGHTLKIVGASKIPGGKAALISKILKVRRKK